ncbi:MAG: alkaline phosphatase, partial [Comamonadaceae bacterium]
MQETAPIDRRQLLRLAVATAAGGWSMRSAWAQARIGDNPFTLGVASGSPDAASVVLWTRLLVPGLDQPATVQWEVAHDEGFARIARRGHAEARPELAHAVHVEADGLEADRGYFYRFMAGPWVSPVGHTRTLPAPDAAVRRLRLAYASCNRWEHGYFGAYRHMRADQPDFVLFLGDYIYEYADAANAVRPTDGVRTRTLEDYRNRYALHRGDPDLQAMHQACPWICTWDDHEVYNDYTGSVPDDPKRGPAFIARRAAAYQAYYEHMPLRASVLVRALGGLQRGGELRLYGEHRFGRLAQLCVLDARQYKDDQACTPDGRAGSASIDPGGCDSWNDPARSMLGAAQERWLDERLARGGAAWSVLGQQSLFGRRDLRRGSARVLWNDGWDGYPQARRRLQAALRKHAPPNPVLLGGDVHENWVGHVLADYERPDSAAIGVEFCGTSITSRPSGADGMPERLADNPHFIHADASQRGYGIAEFSAKRLEVALRVVDDVTRRDTGVATQVQFVVEAG